MRINAKYYEEQGQYLEYLGICFGIRSNDFYARNMKTPRELARAVRLGAANLFRSQSKWSHRKQLVA